MAMLHFVEKKCELVIWETGLGGRLDATNIVHPLASVITNIDLDHQQWLGDTIEQIASEKAGIIKRGVPVITAASPDKGLPIIAGIAREHKAPLRIVDCKAAEATPGGSLKLSLAGSFQRINAALALATVDVLQGSIKVPNEARVTGLATVQWPGRMQRLITAAGQEVLIDGAHNPGGIEVLRAEIQRHFREEKPTIIFGVLRDKDYTTMTRRLAPLAGRLVLTPVKSERSLGPEELLPVAQAAGGEIAVTTCSSLADALQQTAEDARLVICGSLYLVGEAMELLSLSAVPAQDERGLNEWNAQGHEH
jgi:dihydrofolate synthase/folylpolyglutamate synthase